MSSIIKEFWIFSIEGDPLIHFHNEDNQFHFDLPGLDEKSLEEMRAIIRKNSKNLTYKQKFLRFSNLKYNFVQCLKNGSVIFYKTNYNVKEKRIRKICETISHIFEESYKLNQMEFIDKWNNFKKKLTLQFKLSTL